MVKVRKLLNVSLITVLKNNFIFLKKKKGKTHLTTKSCLCFQFFVLYYMFLRIENKVFLENIFYLFYLIFTYFLRVILKNNYINI